MGWRDLTEKFCAITVSAPVIRHYNYGTRGSNVFEPGDSEFNACDAYGDHAVYLSTCGQEVRIAYGHHASPYPLAMGASGWGGTSCPACLRWLVGHFIERLEVFSKTFPEAGGP